MIQTPPAAKPSLHRGFTSADYLAGHQELRRCSDQRDQVLDWFENSGLLEFEEEVPSILSVGAGSGDIDVALIQRLEERQVTFAYDALDPSRVALEGFRTRCASMPGTVANRLWLYEGGFENFEPGQRYDLIHFVHAMYAMPDLRGMVEKAYRLLAPGGKIGVVCSTDEGVNRFKRRVFEEIELPGRAGSVPENELLDAFASLPSAELELELISSQIDVTGALGDTAEGAELLSFFLQSDFESLEVGEQIAVLQALSQEAGEIDGRYSLRQPMLAISVTKRTEAVPGTVSLRVRGLSDDGVFDGLACPS